jgi:hypothetical protein
MSGNQGAGIERPVDFSYDACWFECPTCRDRVVMTFEDRANGQSYLLFRTRRFSARGISIAH